jgi:hypothetical protein
VHHQEDDMPAETTEPVMGAICKLPAPELAARRKEIAALFGEALDCRDMGDGVQLEFAGTDGTARKLLDFVLFERECCPSLGYRLLFDGDPQTIKLAITGAAGLYDWARARISGSDLGPRLGCTSIPPQVEPPHLSKISG